MVEPFEVCTERLAVTVLGDYASVTGELAGSHGEYVA